MAPATRSPTLTRASRTRWISARIERRRAVPRREWLPPGGKARSATGAPMQSRILRAYRASLLHDLALDVDQDTLREHQSGVVSGSPGAGMYVHRGEGAFLAPTVMSGMPSLRQHLGFGHADAQVHALGGVARDGSLCRASRPCPSCRSSAGAFLITSEGGTHAALCRQDRDFRRVGLEVAQFLRRAAGRFLVHRDTAFARAFVHVGGGGGRHEDPRRRCRGSSGERRRASGMVDGSGGERVDGRASVTIPLFAPQD